MPMPLSSISAWEDDFSDVSEKLMTLDKEMDFMMDVCDMDYLLEQLGCGEGNSRSSSNVIEGSVGVLVDEL